MKAVQVSEPNGILNSSTSDAETGRGQVRVQGGACGICHSDELVKKARPGSNTSRSRTRDRRPHHKLGGDVTSWKDGQRVGVGWHGGHCLQCDPCRRGDFVNCKFEKITAIGFDGGYAEYVIVPSEAVALIPEDLPADKPLLDCAGITVFNAMRIRARSRRTCCRPRNRRTGPSRNSIRTPDGISHSRHRARRRQAGLS